MMQSQQTLSLASISTFGIGGEAKNYKKVTSYVELLSALQELYRQKQPYRIVGGGSNIIFPDEGISDLILHIEGGEIHFEGEKCEVDAGVPLMSVVTQAISLGLSGLESLSGIPGTIGGAVVGNAGAYGHSIAEFIEKIDIWDGENQRTFTPEECSYTYRHSIFKERPYVVLRIFLNLHRGEVRELTTISQEIIKKREKKYKPGIKCPGSFFKNIVASEVDPQILGRIDPTKVIYGKVPTGYLLEEVGAKGMREGDIVVADFHGNLLMNIGQGKAVDVKKLAGILKEKVKQRFGIKIQEEIRYF